MIGSRLMTTALALGALSAARSAQAEERAAQPPAPARVRLVKAVPFGAAPWLAATIAAERHATISTRLSAQVRTVLVEEGTQVKRGQMLLTLSDDDVRAQLAAAETGLATAAAYERRILDLAKDRAATPVEVEAAQAQRAQAAAAVAGAKASLAYTQIRAPFDGTIQARRVIAGDLVGPGQPLVELQGAGLEVQANLSEEEAKSLRIGQRLRFDAGGVAGEAQITALSPGGDAVSHRRSLRARILQPAGGLRSGAFARIAVPGDAPREVTWVPRSAVVHRGDLTGVFVAEGGHARLRWISPGETSGDQIAVRAGLAPTDAVIDSPGPLSDDQPVEVVRGD